jgi:mannose-6-phosphate isomerase-like protein (cupin superfamily)
MQVRKSIKSLAVATLAVAAVLAVAVWAQDPVKVGPDVYKSLFENDRIRVNEINFKAGAHIDFHSHPDHVVYWIAGGTLRIWNKGADGKVTDSVDVTGKAGEVLYLTACTHAGTNIGKTDLKLVQVELKEPAPAKPAGK